MWGCNFWGLQHVFVFLFDIKCNIVLPFSGSGQQFCVSFGPGN